MNMVLVRWTPQVFVGAGFRTGFSSCGGPWLDARTRRFKAYPRLAEDGHQKPTYDIIGFTNTSN